jgi:YHS domain-containing protein
MRIRKYLFTLVATLAACSVVGWAKQPAQGKAAGAKSDEKSPKVELPKCPVSGQPVDFFVSTSTADGPVYFCCPDCIPKFKANPKEYAEKVAAQRAAIAKLPREQVVCPISGKPIDKKAFIEDQGHKVYFCCGNCKVQYEADPAAARKKLAAAYTYQTKCPIEGAAIDPAVFIELPHEERVYFCCQQCEEKFLEHPERYEANLAAQGYKVDTAAVKKVAAEQAAKKNDKKMHP